MNQLKEKIKHLRRKNASGGRYIPEAAFFRLMTLQEIQGAITKSKVNTYQRDEVIDRVFPRGRKIFGILLLSDCMDLLQKFSEADQLDDARLPFTDITLTQTILLSDNEATDFILQQWLFTAPTFQRGTINRRLANGSVLPFEEDKRIGEGGFGTVFEVVLHPDHQTLDPTFPRKFVRKEFSKDRYHQHELENLSILNSIKHPNMVELLSSYTYDSIRHNLLFPLAKHGSLKEFLSLGRETTQSWSDDSIIIALAGLSSAVTRLHECTEKSLNLNLIGCHHDLKPSNILVSETTFILADFGLSTLKPSHEDSESPFKSRTDDYVAPECEDWDNDFEQNNIHRSSDIWSLGCIIAEIVTYTCQGPKGIKAFRAARKYKIPGATLFSFHHGQIQSSDAVENWLSDLETSSTKSFALIIQLVRRMLSLNPLDRPKAHEVERFLRFVALLEVSAIVNDQFHQIMKIDPLKLDNFLERLRFTSWGYATGLLDINDEGDIRLDLNQNILDQFDKILDTLTHLRHDLDSRLLRDKTTTHLDLSQLLKLNDELYLFLNQKQAKSSEEYFKVSVCEEDSKVVELLHHGSDSISLTDEIRMRINIKHIRRLLEEDSGPESPAFKIDPDNVVSLHPFGEHHLGRLRTNNDTEGSHPVWVEWRKYGNHGVDEDTVTHLHGRTTRLAELLSRERPEGFRTLHCRGFVHKLERAAFGMIFEFPQSPRAGNPLEVINLSNVIAETQSAEDMPDLDDRLKLASTLAAALLEFHSVDWLHKSLTAENIIFFKEKNVPITQLNLTPWLVGFSHSRPDDPLGLTSGLSDSASAVYQHPVYLANVHGYHREFDYYSLGIILIEIAYWEPLSMMTRKWTGSYEQRRQRLLAGRVPQISKQMGRSYAKAVRFCIESEVSEPASRISRKDVLLRFEQCVVAPLSSFSC